MGSFTANELPVIIPPLHFVSVTVTGVDSWSGFHRDSLQSHSPCEIKLPSWGPSSLTRRPDSNICSISGVLHSMIVSGQTILLPLSVSEAVLSMRGCKLHD
jgi:hypothetical protein